jgi:hypothetical protein
MSSTSEANKKRYEAVIKTEFPKIVKVLENCLDFKRWGFKRTHMGLFPQYLPLIVYESAQCKLKIVWEQDRPYEQPAILILYGRTHALLDQDTMMWNGEKCYCWHMIHTVIDFLDGLSPADRKIVPPAMTDFSEANREKGWSQPEFWAKSHAFLWERYGQRIFDLFDLSRPDLWNKYADDIKAHHLYRDEQTKLKGHVVIPFNPPLHKVC